jgi:hypothetical protein
MGAAVGTISPRVPVRELERLARAQVERDGLAVWAASTDDRWQLRQLRRLEGRLGAGGGLECLRAPVHTGTTYLIVRALGSERPVNWRGDAKTG